MEAGLGVAVLPRLATPAAGHPIIRTVALSDPEVLRTIGIVRRHGAVVSPPAAQFLTMLLETWRSPAPVTHAGLEASPYTR